jgi:hypothetical protein
MKPAQIVKKLFSIKGAGLGEVASPSVAAVSRMSKTEIYVKYAEAASSWKEERLKNRQNEIILEQVRNHQASTTTREHDHR